MSRLKMTVKNIFFGYMASIVTMLFAFVSRTVFIRLLGATYLGVNGLFTNVLGVLSFAELGIGTAMNFSLYKPAAENDREKIKSLMSLYKTAYRAIAAVVAVIGLALVPFLKYIVKDPGNIGNISVYYLIFLFNTVITYFVSYKFSLVNAEQKNYIFSVINTITGIVTNLAQIIVLLLFKSFLAYLLIASFIGMAQKIFISVYLNKMYPYLSDKNISKLSREDLNPIIKNIKALVLHKIGEISVYQTDNIIISAFVNVTTVGLISNYNLILNSVNSFITTAFNAATASLGNLIATEKQNHQYEVFKVYRFCGFWVFGFVTIAIYTLSTPFITLWIGDKMTVANFVVFLIVLDYYFKGHRICINNIKTAGGVFYQDRYVSLIQAVVNLVVSIVMVKLIGLPGVYVGTVLQGVRSNIVKPYITYKSLFNVSPKHYYTDGVKYAAAVGAAWLLCNLARSLLLADGIGILSFAALTALTAIIPNLLFAALFFRREEFLYIKKIIMKRVKKNG